MQKTIFFLVFILLFSLPVTVSSQTDDTGIALYKPLVVQITSKFEQGEELGFGFIVGERKGYLYIVTANHVVRKDDPDNSFKTARLTFYWDQSADYEAKRLKKYYAPLDLALLRIKKTDIDEKHKIDWKQLNWCSQWKYRENVWFIGRQSEEDIWWIPPEAGYMGHANMSDQFRFYTSYIQPGTSGAPLIMDQGIVGMVVKDSMSEPVGVEIEKIFEFVYRLRYPWMLTICASGVYPLIKNPKPPASKKPSQGDTMPETVTGIELVYVPKGCFQMGSPASEQDPQDDEEPVHEVCVDGFWMGKHEVTRGQWRSFVQDTGYRSDAETNAGGNEGCVSKKNGEWGYQTDLNWKEPGFSQSDTYPVVCISYNDTEKFVVWLNKKSKKQYRLPTEAEWEYGCRGNGSGRYCGGNDIDALAWHAGNSNDTTHPVGKKQANSFRFYDMSGNVWEWCADWYSKDYYSYSQKKNPLGASSGSVRVIRGGGWGNSLGHVRAANRFGDSPSGRVTDRGFRLVLSGQ